MYLDSKVREKVLAGLFCPDAPEISLEFLLTSDKLGEATEIITIPITPYIEEEEEAEPTSSASTFAGVNVAEVDAELARLKAS